GGGWGGGASGPGGWVLWVRRRQIDVSPAVSFDGPAIELRRTSDENGSGQYQVAEVLARAFPAYRSYAKKLWELVDSPFPSGPDAGDRLTYRSKTVVEYKTPAGRE